MTSKPKLVLTLALLGVWLVSAPVPQVIAAEAVIDVGRERQLFLDDLWFHSKQGVDLVFHTPTSREVAIQPEHPWERTLIHYSSVVFDQGLFRMWYRATDGNPWNVTPNGDGQTYTCYAQSEDGIHWEKPKLGVFSHGGATANNIIESPKDFMNVSVILDPNEPPGSKSRYKMISRVNGITGFVSADGMNWDLLETNPLLSKGPFDSHNILIWDEQSARFVIYLRATDMSVPGPFHGGRRAIRRSESSDFRNWSEPKMVLRPDEGDPVDLHFYTNAAVNYYRASRAFFMFPMILYPERSYPAAPLPGTSEIQFATSRDGVHWKRSFRYPIIKPGLDEDNWVDRNPIMGHGVVPTGPTEISMYYSEFLRSSKSRIRRCTLRKDGFVSVRGPYNGWGEFTTPAIRFKGRRLEFNYSAAGGGALQVELQDEGGNPVPGFRMEDCPKILGDKIEGVIRWRLGADVSALEGQPIRLRVRLQNADLYAFRFRR